MGRIVINTAEEWHQKRAVQGIGGSEAACILGLNKYKSNVTLWEEKVGKIKREDISDKPAVKYGKEAEKHIRALFVLDYPEYIVEYHEYDLLYNDDYPFIFATLDGELTDCNGRKGVLEVKTTEIQRSTQWKDWDNKVPDNYYIQILHQLNATDFDFAVLVVQIKYRFDGELKKITKAYKWERAELLNDMDYLTKKECGYWQCIQENKRPALILPQI